ncbi:MAG: hypothetical protein O6952_02320, partial [Planctomycetota bacterium]|nr:hypothetical protein [Planctomycetota bacterium]
MIGWFRKYQKVIFYSTMPILALILGLPTVMMAVLGGSQELAYYTVAGEKFDVHRVQGEMNHLRGAYSQLLLSLTNFGLRDQMPTERDAIDRYVLLQQAESAGIEVPIVEVGDRAKDFYSDLIASRQVFTRIRSLPASGRDSAWARLFPAEKSRVK